MLRSFLPPTTGALPLFLRRNTHPLSTRSGHRPGALDHSRYRRLARSKPSSTLPPPDPSVLHRLTSSLPARFTAEDLTSLLSRTRDPLLCLHLFHWASTSHHHHHPRFRPSPSTYLLLIKKLASSPRLLPFLHPLASSALSAFPSRHLSNALIRLYSRARMLCRAASVFRLMRSHPDPSCRPTVRTYNLLLSALVRPEPHVTLLHVSNARCLFRQMLASGIEPDALALNTLIKGHVLSMDVDGALRVFHRMGEVYRCKPDGFTYNWVIRGLCAAGRTRDARVLGGEMEGKGLELGGKAGNSLVSAMAVGGEAREAVRVMWGLVGKGRGVDGVTCGAVVGGLCREGRVGEAVELVGELREKGVVGRRVAEDLMAKVREEYGGGELDGGRRIARRCGRG